MLNLGENYILAVFFLFFFWGEGQGNFVGRRSEWGEDINRGERSSSGYSWRIGRCDTWNVWIRNLKNRNFRIYTVI